MESHLVDVHLGETVAPYVTLPPLRAVLPIDKDNHLVVCNAGTAAQEAAKRQLNAILADNEQATVATTRKNLRAWLETSPEGRSMESAVENLLS
ncbi:hypothetical protein [Candidatus Poriferisocius sp.]|uniref:hypothetical protein n=1 Tax=Candidatus Poriferisocius sp. TaxID=3101276 RepID=UPI003B02060D